MKKVFSLVLLLVLTVGTFNLTSDKVSAAARANQSVGLTTGQTSSSTARVIGNSEGAYNVVNTGKHNVNFRVFKNGVAVTSYITVAPGATKSNSKLTTTKDAGYSLRIYCKSSSGTGCAAAGVITNYKTAF